MASLGSIKYIETDSEDHAFSEPNLTGSPERNLLLAVLERAILDYVGNDAREHKEALEWIFGEHSNKEVFSFSWVCSELDLDQNKVAATIAAMPRRGNKKVAPWYWNN